MDVYLEDIENEIPVNNIQLSQGLSELKVKTTRKESDGFIKTRIERLKVQSELELEDQQKKIYISRPFKRPMPISNTVCLSVEDVKRAETLDDSNCWKAYSSLFRRVLVYGKVIVLNQYSRDNKIRFKFSIDDGTDVIIATMKITKDDKRAVTNQNDRLTLERNKLRRKREIGINEAGKFYPPKSEKCKSVVKSISILQAMTIENVREQKTNFLLGPIQEKALILASLYKNGQDEVQLNIIDLSLDDKIELAWKRQLNKLYLKEYLKQSKA